MNATDFVKGGEYIRKEDLEKDGERTYTIHSIDVAEFGDAKKGTTERKLQLVLNDGARLTLNSTNTRILIKHYTDDTAAWTGKPVVLVYDEAVQYAGRMVGGIRIKVPAAKPSPRPTRSRPVHGGTSDTAADANAVRL